MFGIRPIAAAFDMKTEEVDGRASFTSDGIRAIDTVVEKFVEIVT